FVIATIRALQFFAPRRPETREEEQHLDSGPSRHSSAPPRAASRRMTITAAARATGPLGQMLVTAGVITADDLDAALAEQSRTGERLGAVLVRRGADAEHVARILARQLRLPHAAAPLQPDADAIRFVDRSLATRLRVVPLAVTERTLRVAMADPLDVAAMDDLRFRTGRRIDPCVATPVAVDAALVAAYSAHAVSDVLTKLPGARDDEPSRDVPPEMVDSLRRASEA